ncbi:hypothetical protein ACRALDRAFT_1070443 [Sodiomyces alcalophilus JCM 7366]|uniref:uncharacterized protein n=1 Tax=Sodiomyces alcalophilus JCM 7366 TaxID=591952 RepID=UPI0039B5D3BC
MAAKRSVRLNEVKTPNGQRTYSGILLIAAGIGNAATSARAVASLIKQYSDKSRVGPIAAYRLPIRTYHCSSKGFEISSNRYSFWSSATAGPTWPRFRRVTYLDYTSSLVANGKEQAKVQVPFKSGYPLATPAPIPAWSDSVIPPKKISPKKDRWVLRLINRYAAFLIVIAAGNSIAAAR